jgi:hypothetical protein
LRSLAQLQEARLFEHMIILHIGLGNHQREKISIDLVALGARDRPREPFVSGVDIGEPKRIAIQSPAAASA